MAAHDRPGDPASAGEFPPPPAKGAPLTREQVLSMALAIIDAEGVEALSMRRLGQALDRDPMRLYRHADTKAQLLDAVTEHVMADLRVPALNGGGWQHALRRTAVHYRAIALAHPNMVPLMVTRPLATPLGLRPLGTVRPLENILALLIDAGFSPQAALHGYRLFFGFLQGHILNQAQELVSDPEETDDVLRLGLHHLPIREFPHTRALASTLANYDGELELHKGLDILLEGLSSQLSDS
ncbi:TetR/AcrR family transcriptional regulator C-terminal domain-containing protein [Spirillospora sp. NPDC048911]|uniref:TetR/AcrR family transcriptional regulator C-terminal domain-containing protein n=1 Tax=Spirillospora sp. NPDC048911 TaxID=3364527 RepID=UPI00372287F7